MITPALANTLAKNAAAIGAGVAIVAVVAYLIARRTITEVAETAGGIVTGDNALTRGTPYQGAGVLGTLGAATNAASGGTFQAIGEKIVSVFTPNVSDAERYDLMYGVLFPDGRRRAVRATEISKDGVYALNGALYLIGYNQANERVATPL